MDMVETCHRGEGVDFINCSFEDYGLHQYSVGAACLGRLLKAVSYLGDFCLLIPRHGMSGNSQAKFGSIASSRAGVSLGYEKLRSTLISRRTR